MKTDDPSSLYGPNAAMAFQPLPAVKVEDDFWLPRYNLWRSTTIPDVLGKLASRSHVAADDAFDFLVDVRNFLA